MAKNNFLRVKSYLAWSHVLERGLDDFAASLICDLSNDVCPKFAKIFSGCLRVQFSVQKHIIYNIAMGKVRITGNFPWNNYKCLLLKFICFGKLLIIKQP